LVKIGPFENAKFIVPLVEDFRAENVRRQQVDRELNPGELQVDRFREDRDEQRLGQARDALQQEVPAGKQRDQHSFNDDVLSDDDRRDALADALDEFRNLFDRSQGHSARRGNH
jgi:hypothetical protein